MLLMNQNKRVNADSPTVNTKRPKQRQDELKQSYSQAHYVILGVQVVPGHQVGPVDLLQVPPADINQWQ